MRYAYQAYEKSCNVLNFHDFVGRIRRSRRIRQEAIRKGGDHLRPFYFCNPQLSSRKSILFGSTRNALQVIIMGLFDEVVGAFLKGDAGKYQAILSWVEEQGGIQVLLEKLQSGGLGAILSTWLSNQQGNQSVSGEQLESALGTNAVSDLDKNLAWIPVQLPVYWQNNCRRLLMRSHRKVKCLHKPITICFPQAWNC